MATRRRLFVPIEDIQKSVDDFLWDYRTAIHAHTDKISQYAEIAAYNAVVKYYDSLGFRSQPDNLVGNKFRYKLQPTGDPRKYSRFMLRRKTLEFALLNNVSVESAHAERHYFTADIVVADPGELQINRREDNEDIGIRRSTFAIRNRDVKTFLEVKNLPAFPELLFSFSGLLFEVMPDIFFRRVSKQKRLHIAPSLVCSFAGSGHANYIRRTLLKRWHVNIFVDFLKARTLNAPGANIRLIANKRLRFPQFK